jgi:hypothetical protein
MPPDQLVLARAYSRTAAIFCLCELDCLGKSFFCGLMADDVETGILTTRVGRFMSRIRLNPR